ncbi:Threonine/homoserine/homoserine lactone efflux protein [Saccharopolyspora kobensis]|uniref:Threonine/homoserine/homoserine lactone efflux protein n=1 Tax=Saccharopolyspora kobensis TaxID=146035 RepID=A0A1H6BYI0_9PSEU|nr:LysE family translocator [Saccharopolyspora kobensis]SEG65712.1 Threonine/homoserine/homoserine lactone efflux protein [Saccharopolyspora kobensis]SFC20758.1 Threonine/homoserine/homoserine lactone efflux protein [Saccharopolyspora kobensis]
MSSATFTAFALVALIGVLTPGLDTMLILRHSLLGGRWAGVATAFGINLGCLIWGTASIAGLTALLTASQLAYDIVRIAGAAYLLWLGGSALWKSLPRNQVAQPEELPSASAGLTSWAALRSGMATNLLNPKVGVFYISLLPQFLPAGPAAFTWGPLLVATHISIGLLWSTALVWIAGRARALFQRRRVRAWLDRITATVLVGLGLKMAVQG